MADFLKKFPSKILDFFKNMEKAKRARLIVLVTFIIIIIVTVSVVLGQKSYSTLYSGMDPAEAGEVLTVLSEMNVDAKPQGDNTILVEDEEIDTVRMQLAAQGYPNSGVNYDIFQKATGLGVTDMEKQKYYQFQLQANIEQTIKKMDKIDDAVVNIDLPEESSFVLSDNNKSATAAVMLTLKRGQQINNSEVKAIAELVSSSIGGLELEDVRIVDSKMNLYSITQEDEMENLSTQRQLQQSVQRQFHDQIINLLTPVFGEGNILTEVNVILNFDTKKTESVEFAPPAGGTEGIAVSIKKLNETIKNAGDGGVPGVDNNGGGTSYPALDDEDAVYQKISEEANYEINQTKTQIEDAKGQIEDLSVSVILNSAENYEDYRENVRNLVATAIGVNADRITVERLPFKAIEGSTTDNSDTQQAMISSVQQAETTRLLIILGAGLIVLLFLFLIIRMFRPRAVEEEYDEDDIEYGIDLVADEEIVVPDVDKQEIEFGKQEENREVLADYIKQDAETVANLLRNWLNDEN